MASNVPEHHNVERAVPFFRVADMEASLRYYVDGLGFRVADRWAPGGRVRWCRLELGGAAVMLQEDGPYHHSASPSTEPAGRGVSIYFICTDALTLYRTFVARGIAAGRPFVGNAMWVTSLIDPDGYNLFFESPTDVAEETVYRP